MTEEELKSWKSIVDKEWNRPEAKERRQKQDRYYKEYCGEWWGVNEETGERPETYESKIQANWLFSVINTIMPLLTDSRPIWHVLARFPHYQQLANQYNEAGKYLWDKLELDNKLLLSNVDAALMKNGFWKVYFDGDDVSIDVIDPRTFITAAGTVDLWKAPWCGTKDSVPTAVLREMYPDVADEIKPDSGDPEQQSQREDKGGGARGSEFTTVYELWARDGTIESVKVTETDENGDEVERTEKREKYPNGRLITFTNAMVELRDDPSPFDHGRPPYIVFYDYFKPHDFWGIAEADQIEDLVRQYNINLRKLAANASRYGGVQLVVDEDSGIDEQDFLTKVATGADHVHRAKFVNGDPVQQIPIPQVPNTVVGLIELIPKLIEEVSGVTDLTKGRADKRQRQSAMEVQILIESSYTRMRQRVRNLEWSIGRAFQLICSLMMQYYDETRQYSVEQDGGMVPRSIGNSKQFAIDSTRDDSKREKHDGDWLKIREVLEPLGDLDPVIFPFDIQIQTNSTLPQDMQTRANQALRLFEMKGIDREALLETLQWPNAEETLKRIEKQQQDAQRAKQRPTESPRVAGPPRTEPMGAAQQGRG